MIHRTSISTYENTLGIHYLMSYIILVFILGCHTCLVACVAKKATEATAGSVLLLGSRVENQDSTTYSHHVLK